MANFFIVSVATTDQHIQHVCFHMHLKMRLRKTKQTWHSQLVYT